MKPIVSELQTYIEKYFKAPYDKVCKTLRFSTIQTRFLNDLHSRMMNAHLEWFNQSHTITQSAEISNPNLENYHYIPEEFRRVIETDLKPHREFRFTVGKRKISVTFYADAQKSFHDKNWALYLQKIYIWLTVADKFASAKCAKHLHIFLYLTPLLKTMPESHEMIDRKHANTAFTTACTDTTEIHLYREEEWLKVCIHETFHSLGLDFSTMEQSAYTKQIQVLYGLHHDVRLYESYAEIWAEMINTCMVVHYSMIYTKKNTRFVEQVRKALCYEITFSMIQCTKILQHYELVYDDLLNQPARVYEHYREKTPVFSYYIVKPVLMFYIGDFIEWTMIHNRGSFDFLKTKANVDSYIQFIQQHRTKSEYCSLMHSIHTLYQTVKDGRLTGSKTMRMTLFED